MSAGPRPLGRRWRRSALACACVIGLSGTAAFGAASAAAPAPGMSSGPSAPSAPDKQSKSSSQITSAERLIFTTDHLHDVAPQTELDYAMTESGENAHGADVVRVLVTSRGNAKGDAKVSDHGGAVTLPNDGLPCNPVIIYFLERDISEMSALTGGQRRYFQKRLRIALAQGPTITSTTAQVDGKAVAVRQIVVQPYLRDPNAERFTRYTAKRYTFAIADALPGQVAQIRTEVPGPNGDFAHPVKTETLTFKGAVHKLPAPGPASGVRPTDVPSASH